MSDGVGCDDKPRAAIKFKRQVSRGVPGSANDTDPVGDLIPSSDKRYPLFDGFEILLCLKNDTSKVLRELQRDVRAIQKFHSLAPT